MTTFTPGKPVFNPGDLVNVTLRNARVQSHDGDGLTLHLGGSLTVGIPVVLASAPAVVETERVATAEWPPLPGDLWRDRHGDVWFFRQADHNVRVVGYTAGARWTDTVDALLTDGNAPWTLVRREGSTDEHL